MADWLEFRNKFKNDLDQAALGKERATQKQRLVDAKQSDLWKALRDETRSAVEAINGSDGKTLRFKEEEEAETKRLRVIYVRDGQERSAQAEFKVKGHTIAITALNSNRRRDETVFNIRADDEGDVYFDLANNGGRRTPEQIVTYMLEDLL